MTNVKFITIATFLVSFLLCSCGNSRKETEKNSNPQMEANDSLSVDSSVSEITPEMAFEGVNNYCHQEYDWSIAEENPDIMTVTMGEESGTEYQVVFRSYTGAFVHFYVDKKTGKTRIFESVPSMNIKEEKGCIDLHNYLGKGMDLKTTTSNKESSETKNSLTGMFVSEYDGSSLTITARNDGRYSVVVDLFRLTSLDDGVGVDAEGGIDFTATDAAGNPIGGRITLAADMATLTFVHSTWSLIENGAKWEFNRKKSN